MKTNTEHQKKRRWLLSATWGITGFALVCSCAKPVADTPGRHAIVSILPQQSFVSEIAGDRFTVEALVQAGRSPETYAPTLRQMNSIGAAAVFFHIGMPFEHTMLPRLAERFPNLSIVDCRQGIEMRHLSESEGHCHDHGGDDPHVWLDPMNAKRISAGIRDELIRLDPAGETIYKANFNRFAERLDELHERLKTLLEPVRDRKIYVFHPAYGYFTDAYGLQQVAVEYSGNQPSARHLTKLIEQARRESVRAVFVQPQFSQQAAETIAKEIEGKVVPLDPLAADYIVNLEAVAEKTVAALQ